jgi:hypothetical protein
VSLKLTNGFLEVSTENKVNGRTHQATGYQQESFCKDVELHLVNEVVSGDGRSV